MSGNPLHILVVENDLDTRASVRAILERDGYEVETAMSMQDALQQRSWPAISAVIADCQLPDASAVQLVPEIRRRSPSMPILIVAEVDTEDEAVEALREGAYDYLLKPIRADALRLRVKRIIERRWSEQKLAESEARHRALLDAIPDTMLRISRDGVLLDLRLHPDTDPDVWCEDLIQRDLRDSILPEELLQQLERAIALALSGNGAQTIEHAVQLTGHRQHFELRVVRSGEDEVVAIVRDVTAHKQAEGRALQAERLAAIGQMVAGLAHESRNAFQRSQACLEMLTLEVEQQPEALDLVERIQKAQNHLHYLYEEVRSYAAPISPTRQTCDLQQIWRDTWGHLELERAGRSVRLQERVGGVDLTCRADPNALEQVFRNVLENALFACPESGVISIECSTVTLDEQEAIEVRIHDNGPGFDNQSRHQVFEPFFTTKTSGTGLGMAIARRIVEAHGGQARVGNHYCSGAEIVITLPR